MPSSGSKVIRYTIGNHVIGLDKKGFPETPQPYVREETKYNNLFIIMSMKEFSLT